MFLRPGIAGVTSGRFRPTVLATPLRLSHTLPIPGHTHESSLRQLGDMKMTSGHQTIYDFNNHIPTHGNHVRRQEFHAANHTGNEKADRLADAGSRGQVGEHSKRWAAPHRLALTAVNTEKCRKCGRFFRDARICGTHEKTCTAGPAILTDEQPCRKCGEMQKDRKARTAHEAKCTSDAERNK